MKVKLTVTRKGKTIIEVSEGVASKLERAVSAALHDFLAAAKLRCPVSGTVRQRKGWPGNLEALKRVPGRLRASLVGRAWRKGQRYYGSVGFTEPYGLYLEFGTGGPKSPPIKPRKDGGKKALAFVGGRPRQLYVVKSSRGGPIRVGTARSPLTFWKALAERTGRRQTMPFLRPAWYLDTLAGARERFRRALRKGA